MKLLIRLQSRVQNLGTLKQFYDLVIEVTVDMKGFSFSSGLLII